MQTLKLENPHSHLPNLDVTSHTAKPNLGYWFCTLSVVRQVSGPFALPSGSHSAGLPWWWW